MTRAKVLIGLFFLFSLGRTEATRYSFTFENDLEGWGSKRGAWHWSTAGGEGQEPNLPPSKGIGFAIMDQKFNSDELYTQKFSLPEGGALSVTYFVKSEYTNSVNFDVDLLENDMRSQRLIDAYSSPDSSKFLTTTVQIEPNQEDLSLMIFCYNGNSAPAGEYMNGCAIDEIVIEVPGGETTTTTAAPVQTTSTTTTTPLPTTSSTTSTASTTTSTSSSTIHTSTATPTISISTSTITSTIPTTSTSTTTSVIPSTSTSTTTSTIPTTSTSTTTSAISSTSTSTTAESTSLPYASTSAAPTGNPTDSPSSTSASTTITPPQGPLVFNFSDSTQGWSLTNMNGAHWRWTEFDDAGHNVGIPPYGSRVLQVSSTEVFSSTVTAQSPQLQATDTEMKVTMTFWMNGSQATPSRLKVRRRKSFGSFDVSPIINLDPYGDQENFQWLTVSGTLGDLQIGDTFSIILEGSLGVNVENSVAVDRIMLEGVKAVDADPSEFFDFENGLLGWTQTNMDGGYWALQNYSAIDASFGIPAPEGDFLLLVKRFKIHSGVIALESPPFPVSPGERKKVHIKFWSRGSVAYPASLRLRKKSLDGRYDSLPFINLAPYGDVDNSNWLSLDKYYVIPVNETETAFQLVIEADLGSGQENMIALDNMSIVTEYIEKSPTSK